MIQLDAAGLGTLALERAGGYVVTELDLGFPSVRAVTADRVNASGADDTTALHGARAALSAY